MADKLTAAVTVKLTESLMHSGSALTQLSGMCLSEYMRHLLDQALAAKEAEYRALDAIFGATTSSSKVNAE